ncbi:MAG: FAD-dependent oxidoreductase [Alphaproteobacteria bacterium]|nr:FAD-dependent oxidoreductase [Alphaproteobacteria bacterium]
MALELKLGFHLSFDDLYTLDGLMKVDGYFQAFLNTEFPILGEFYHNARQGLLNDQQKSALILDLAAPIEDFVASLFNNRAQILWLQAQHQKLAPLITVKRQFVQRYAVKKYPKPNPCDGAGIPPVEDELQFAQTIAGWLDNETHYQSELDAAARYAAWATLTSDGQDRHGDGVLFKLPKKNTDVQETNPHYREGFKLTDRGLRLDQAIDQTNYCIWCHHREKDSCSKGLGQKSGCPLDQKISEMNELKSQGYSIAALATAIIDNPMIAATGHRICNDCTKACIYQKQDPVDIPGVETQILRDVLNLPWGFEIYSLLTRWNPFNFKRPLPLPGTGKKILVAGMGPAGFTLAHYLLNDGHTVVGIDGLKIEPLSVPFAPIHTIQSIQEDLDDRIVGGFGGVAEYGITVRWDKNFLKIIRLLLERRSRFSVIGGVRLDGTVTIDQAIELGFDHVALCLGAGSPKLIPMENSLAPGVRQASDFLMALQLTGAAKMDSFANLQIRLPIVVIGGGLTAIDTATEALAYYPVQVEKFLMRYESLVNEFGDETVRFGWTVAEQSLANEMMAHAMSLRQAQTPADKHRLLTEWGGSTIVYRGDFKQSPGSILNPEEVKKALEEGIQIVDHATPIKVVIDADGHANGLLVDHEGMQKIVPARTILIAAGTGQNATAPGAGKAVSFFGDCDPSFAGSVVKAMASAKRGYPALSRALKDCAGNGESSSQFLMRINILLRAHVHEIKRLTPTIVEVVIKAPMAARNFKPGQFYRLQNFETIALGGLVMEGIALTGAMVDADRGLLSLIVLEMGGSSNLCAHLKVGEPVTLMGPTGTPTEIPTNETVLLIGGGLGNAVLFSIGQAMKAAGCRVLYFAGYKKPQDLFMENQIEQAADQIVWCCDALPGLLPNRPQDLSFIGNIVDALKCFGNGTLGRTEIPLNEVDRILVIGSDQMMAAVTRARHTILKPFLRPNHLAIGSINSPMQCMMKGICGQCLQHHVDPHTGEEKIVFSCINQDQGLDCVSFDTLKDRLGQNSVQEKLTRLWIASRLNQLIQT